MSKKFSIVTVTRNNSTGLRNTLESIQAQSYDDFEVVVIDGNSTDGSERVAAEFGDLVTIFEQDEGKGIYPAMNQGVRRAKGEWVIFMNSGDTFAQSKALELFDANSRVDIAFGKSRKPDGSPHLEFRGWERIWMHMPFSHQSVFAKRSLLLARPYSVEYRIVADYEWLLWAYSEKHVFHQLDYEVSQIEEGGVSEAALVRRVWETYRAAVAYFPKWRVHFYYLKKMKWAFKQRFVVKRGRF